MIRTSSHVLNVQENIMTSNCASSPYSCEATSACAEAQQVMIDNFVFFHMYTADIQIDAKVQCGVRSAAFAIIDDKHLEMYKYRIENKFFITMINVPTLSNPIVFPMTTVRAVTILFSTPNVLFNVLKKLKARTACVIAAM